MIEGVDYVRRLVDRTTHRALDASSWITVLLGNGLKSGGLLEIVYLV